MLTYNDSNSSLLPTWRQRYTLLALSLAASVVVGFGSYVIRADLQQSISLGLMAMLTLLIIEIASLVISLINTVRITNERIDAVFSGLASRGELFSTIDHLRGYGRDGVEVIGTLGRLHESLREVPPVLVGLANDCLTRTAEEFSQHEIKVSGGSVPKLGIQLVRSLRSRAFATSFHPLDFWMTAYGQNYHRETCARMREKSRNGCTTFRRVFIIRDDAIADLCAGPYHNLICEQIDAGVDVHVCYESQLSKDLLRDFGLWDGELEVVLATDQDRRVVTAHYRYSPEALAAAERRASDIWDRSVKFVDWLSVVRVK